MKIRIIRSCMVDGAARAVGDELELTPVQAHAAISSGRSELVDPRDAREMHAAMHRASIELNERAERRDRAARAATTLPFVRHAG